MRDQLNQLSIRLVTNGIEGAKIRVVGVGGGGGNVLNTMVDKGIDGVEFIAINTDSQSLKESKANVTIQIGKIVTSGLGTGMREDIGLKAVEESRAEIERALTGSDMVFITAGMGGGTGTGAAPEIAHIAKGLGALVVSIVTKPFDFEGKPRMELAKIGLANLKKEVDSLIVIPNQKIMTLIGADTSDTEAFEMADRVLYNATRGISQIITKTGKINVDFADIRTIMKDMGDAMIGTGISDAENRAEKAALDALSNPLLDEINIEGSKCVLVNIASSGKIKMREIEHINDIIIKAAGNEAKYILGIVKDENLKDSIMVTVIATGFNSSAEDYKTVSAEEPEALRTRAAKSAHIYSIPSDPSDLDKPAFERMGYKLNDDFSEVKKPIKEKKVNEEFGFGDFNADEEYKKPAFLRRQMD
jgi:cell division protein FtsZ